MSGGEQKSFGTRGVEVLLLLVFVAVMLVASKATPGGGGTRTLAGLGFLLLAGTVLASLLEPLGIPHLTAYLLAGMAAGPYALGVVDHQTVTDLEPVNALALSLIALAGGAELRISTLRQGLRSLAWATLLQNTLVLVLTAGTFLALERLLPFTSALTTSAALGVALLWGVMAITRSPSATLGVLSQTRAKGPLATFTLTFVMTSDVAVVLLLTVVFTVARPLILPGTPLSLGAFAQLGHEVVGSVAVGVTLGLVLAAYLRFVGRDLVLLFVALGLVMTQVMDYLRFEWLLIFITAGFLVQNLSKQGERFLQAIERLGEIVYVIFFATAGAHLNLPLLGKLWPVALALAGARAVCTLGAGRLSSRLAQDGPSVRRWGWAGLVSQAGLALGISAKIQREFPSFGAGFASMAVATVALNELLGPILFKLSLDRTGESAAQTQVEGLPAPAEPRPEG
jgi:Kef-type K+ transport system membrane component KefB